MSNFLVVVETLLALLVLGFLVVLFTYSLSPQKLDRFLHSVGIHQGIRIFNVGNVFYAFRQLGYVLAVLGVLTLLMIWLQKWPEGWLIPTTQELVMAIILIFLGTLGKKQITKQK